MITQLTAMVATLAITAQLTAVGVPAQTEIYVAETFKTTQAYTQSTTKKALPNGDIFTAEKYQFTGAGDQTLQVEIPIQGTVGTATYLDEENIWQTVDLLSDLPVAFLYVQTDLEQWLFDPAYHYIDVGSTTIEDVHLEQPMAFSQTDDGFVCTVTLTNSPQVEAYFWTLQSDEILIPIEAENQQLIWSGYAQRESQRYGYDGYYWESPVSYQPYSEDMFWRTPTSYGPSSFTVTGGSRASDDLSYAWLDTIVDNAEPEGYWLTYPTSMDFLYQDYGMSGGFYDTRFNTDITEVLLVAHTKTGDDQFLEAAIKQVDFFMNFAKYHHYPSVVEGNVGILVEDYYHPTDDYLPTHCSLNHQLAEIYTLYLAYEKTGDKDYMEMADLMLQGIRNTADLWVLEDHSLAYAYMSDGTMGLTDYPFLTYNDLYEVQEQREKMGLDRDETLDDLMSEKLIHMEENGITGYRK